MSSTDRWRPEALHQLARDFDHAARWLRHRIDSAAEACERSAASWTGDAAEAAREQAQRIAADTAAVAHRLVSASAAAQDGAEQLTVARNEVLSGVAAARRDGFIVADDGTVSVGADPEPLLVLLSGGDEGVAEDMLVRRAAELSARLCAALDSLGAADDDAARDITAALTADARAMSAPAATVAAGAWPVGPADVVDGWPQMSQERIAGQISAMTAEQRDRLVTEFPQRVGNTDGVPFDMRVAANRINIAAAILAETGDDEGSRRRIALYRGLLGELDDPVGGPRLPRQILAFDPARASVVELHGDLSTARGVAVLVPGVNTTVEGSAANTATARRFVSGTRGDVAVITYLGGPFPQVRDPAAAVNAADARFALDMAPRLVAFTEDLDRRVGGDVPVTVIGHSYGGSIVGTAETLGLTSDRTLFLAAAGAGVGVDDPGDWHNRNPAVQRFSMTAPGDFIELVQGVPGGPHGADPDEMPTVTTLDTGFYDDGSRVAGWDAHSGMLNRPSDSWRTILAVITGDAQAIRAAASSPGAH